MDAAEICPLCEVESGATVAVPSGRGGASQQEALLRVGERFAGLEVRAVAGRGAMGVVYRAVDPALARDVALKIVSPALVGDTNFRERFQREARLAAQIEHPAVVPVYAAGEHDGRLFLAMRFIAGTNLAALLAEGPLTPEHALRLLGPVADALDAAHDRGLVHRDVKPANVLVGGDRAYVGDFGIAVQERRPARQTGADQLFGTPAYMAPEQIRGGELDGTADVYALGAVLFHCLTGRPPFPGEAQMDVLSAHLTRPPPPATAVNAALPAAVDSVICKALSKRPEDRFATAGQLIEAAEEAFREHVGARDELAVGESRKLVTVVACELVDPTALRERLEMELLQRVLSRFWSEMAAAARRHGGVVEWLIGDAVLAVFGLPALHEDDALRAVRAAAGMRQALDALNVELDAQWGVRLRARVGVHTGEVLAGTVAAGQGVTSGETVSVAAALAQAAGAGEVLLAEPTYRLVRDAVAVAPLEPWALPSVAAFRLVEVRDAPAGLARRLDAPLVGREAELSQLLAAFERVVVERACSVVTVVGEAGVGKSRLMRELLLWIGDGSDVLQGRCLSYGEGMTFWPVRELLEQAAGIDKDDGTDAALAKIQELLERAGEPALIGRQLAGAVGFADVSATGGEIFWAIRRLLEALGRRRPLVVVFEDLHWAEPTFHDLLEYLRETADDVPILIVCTARSELLVGRPRSASGDDLIRLVPLAQDQMRRLVQQLLEHSRSPEPVLTRLVEIACGNPLFVEELLRMLVDDGVLARARDGWTVGDLSRLELPTSLQGLLGARLERLTPAERAVVERGAVIGEVFWRGAVEYLAADEPRVNVKSALSAQTAKQLVQPAEDSLAGEDAYRFGHILMRDAAYRALLKESRARLHRRFADWLEPEAGDGPEYDEILGHHLELAARYAEELALGDPARLAERAGARLAAAGTRARERDDLLAAIGLLTRATRLLADGSRRAELLTMLGEALRVEGDLERARDVLDDAVVTAGRAADRRVELHALIGRARLQVRTVTDRAVAEVPAFVDDAVAELTALDDQEGLARAWQLRCDARWMAGQQRAAADDGWRALEHAARSADRRTIHAALLSLVPKLGLGPTPVDEVLSHVERFRASLVESRAVDAELRAVFAALLAMRGDIEPAWREYRFAAQEMHELGMRFAASNARQIGWEFGLASGDWRAAERELRLGYEEAQRLGDRGNLATIAAQLGEAVLLQGREQEAERLSQESEDAAGASDIDAQVRWRRLRSLVVAKRDPKLAERLIRSAVKLADQTDMVRDRAAARADLAEVLRCTGRYQKAQDAATEALDLATAKGHRGLAARASALLSRIAQEPTSDG